MKIEKINENQIRCTLTRAELADRQIKLSELAYGSEKARSLFRDMIEQANYEFGFEADDIPLMIEAIPLSGENIILQITKVEYPEELDTRFSKFSEDTDGDADAEGDIFADKQGADDILGLFKEMEEKESTVEETETETKESNHEETVAVEVPKNLTRLFEFRSLEQLERLASVLGDFYTGENDVYKDERTNRYYLFVRKSGHSPEEFNKVCNIISEYAVCRKYMPATEAYFREHGKSILKCNALEVLQFL